MSTPHENPATENPAEWLYDRERLEKLQLEKLNLLLKRVTPASALYREKLGAVAPRIESLDELATLTLTTKEDLIEASASGAWRTEPDEKFVRFHQTSGTRGQPMAVLDTDEDWRGWMRGWRHTLAAARITARDRALLAFSFGPFIGFWSAFDALAEAGAGVVPGGGMSTAARAELIMRSGATCLFCTPTYALRLAEAAREVPGDAAASVETVVVAGEPGGSLPATRRQIAQAWGARVVDHAGATEAGPWGFGDDLWSDPPGLRVVESEFIAELISVETGRRARDGELARLVLTNLSRYGSPIVRYATGDLVRPERANEGPCRFLRLAGGVVGREDDMIVVRGVNVFPSSVEQAMREVGGVDEWRLIAERRREMDELTIEIEAGEPLAARVAQTLELRLGLRVGVRAVARGSLPRTEHKANRLVDNRG